MGWFIAPVPNLARRTPPAHAQEGLRHPRCAPAGTCQDGRMRSPIPDYLQNVLNSCSRVQGGQVADYLKELSEVPSELFAIAVCTVDGHLRSEEHTSELQSRGHLVCRLLPEKKNAGKCMADREPE